MYESTKRIGKLGGAKEILRLKSYVNLAIYTTHGKLWTDEYHYKYYGNTDLLCAYILPQEKS